jgi:hypothetical protein
MKDVAGCDKPRGAVKQALIRGFPNGAIHPALMVEKEFILCQKGGISHTEFIGV